MTTSTQAGKTEWILLVVLGVIWGASFMAVQISLEDIKPLTIAAFRISIAAVILTTFAYFTGREIPGRGQGPRIWFHIVGFAFLSNAAPFALLSWGQQHVASSFAGITMAVVPLFVLPLAHVFVPSEQMNLRKSLGFIAGFAGVAILIGPAVFQSTGGSLEDIGRIACILAAICYACGSVTTRTAPPAGMISYAAAALVIATVMIVPYALIVEGIPRIPSTRSMLATAYLAIGPTAIATLIMVRVIRQAGSSFLSLVNYQVPIWSLIFGTIFLSEVLPSQFIGALALILGGLAISQTRSFRKK
jgi:drug/metabolite transporter (DMT)-like permease